MKNSIHYVPLEKITPLIEAENTDAYLKRMKKYAQNLLDYDVLLSVEKDHTQDVYYLVGGYDRYEYLRTCTDEKLAPCIVEATSGSDQQRLFKVLHRFSNKGDTTKPNKQAVLDLLKQIPVTMQTIVRKTGFTEKHIRDNFEYHTNIPHVYINKNTSHKTMNWIESLPLDRDVKYFLFERAGWEKGNSKRLTLDSMKIIQSLLKKEPTFRFLTPDQQIQVLTCAINFKGIVVSLLIGKVEELLRTKKSSRD